jgi:hypothetical protein
MIVGKGKSGAITITVPSGSTSATTTINVLRQGLKLNSYELSLSNSTNSITAHFTVTSPTGASLFTSSDFASNTTANFEVQQTNQLPLIYGDCTITLVASDDPGESGLTGTLYLYLEESQ